MDNSKVPFHMLFHEKHHDDNDDSDDDEDSLVRLLLTHLCYEYLYVLHFKVSVYVQRTYSDVTAAQNTTTPSDVIKALSFCELNRA